MSVLKTLSGYRKPLPNNEPDNSLQSIAYNNSNITYAGRWVDTGSGKWSGWGGARAVFKIVGTGVLYINLDVIDNSVTEYLNVTVYMNREWRDTQLPTTAGGTYNGSLTIEVPIPLSSSYTTVEVYLLAPGAEKFDQTVKATITGYVTGGGAQLATWTMGATRLQYIGDSWAAATNSWMRLLSTSTYNMYPVCSGRITCADADSYYNYDYSGQLNSSDPTADKVLVSFGVNDLINAISVASFQTSLLSLVDKIRVKQPSATIYLVRVPNNVGSGDNYGQYGSAMSTVAGLRSNVTYIDTTSLDATITWLSDDQHLDESGKQVMADFVAAQIA